MDLIFEGIKKAFWLLVTFDPEVMRITLLSLQISGTATLISLLVGVSTGVTVALSKFPGRQIVVASSIQAWGFACRGRPFRYHLSVAQWPSRFSGDPLYTRSHDPCPGGYCHPIVMGITLAAIQQLPRKLRLQILALGATRLQMVWILIKEARLPLLAAVMAGFGGSSRRWGPPSWSVEISRLFPGPDAATVMETSRGNFDVAIALGIILLLLAYLINLVLTHIQQRERPR